MKLKEVQFTAPVRLRLANKKQLVFSHIDPSDLEQQRELNGATMVMEAEPFASVVVTLAGGHVAARVPWGQVLAFHLPTDADEAPAVTPEPEAAPTGEATERQLTKAERKAQRKAERG